MRIQPVPRCFAVAVLLATAAGCPTFSDDVQRDELAEPEAAAVEPGPDDPDAPEEFTTTDSGLKYRILRKGSGEQPQEGDTVRVHYRGWLDDGTEFDSSYQRGEPAEFPLNKGGLIDGWVEGIPHVAEGGKIELEI
ncbi:MAG: FKBP-type peptidyl-prolyl cis-trans isomerase, partial [Planctomycetaceae bacterium]